jgi:hypothetical protein
LARSEDTEEDRLQSVYEFIKKNELNKGFSRKPIDFFYFWYTIGHTNDITLQEFRKAFPQGPFVYFSMDKLNIPKEEFGRINFEYERQKAEKKRKKLRNKKKSIKVSLSKPKNEYTD